MEAEVAAVKVAISAIGPCPRALSGSDNLILTENEEDTTNYGAADEIDSNNDNDDDANDDDATDVAEETLPL